MNLSFLAVLLAATAPARAGVTIEPVALSAAGQRLPLHAGGRIVPDSAAPDLLWRQWPGSYFETRVAGSSAAYAIGPGDAIVRVSADGKTVAVLRKPQPGAYALKGLGEGRHRLRIEIISESGSGATAFRGFFAPEGSLAKAPKPRKRQIEFIGDSHTVGYGNTSATRDCTTETVWDTTDTSQTFGVLLAHRYRADYRIHAISGRGIVRNYGGMAADTLPTAYPFLLFDKQAADSQTGWQPQIIVIALGTNDFSTPLHEGEPWADRAALHADYETRYIRFVQDLRARNPQAFFMLWATDAHGEEIANAVAAVAQRLRALGETRLAFVPVTGLDFAACHAHPSLADEARIARLLRKVIGAQHGIWRRPGN